MSLLKDNADLRHDIAQYVQRDTERLAALTAAQQRVAVLRDALRLVEFNVRGYCGACDGWMVGPNGATPRVHTADCPVRAALASTEPKA